jgi:hypothetical protein
VKKQQLGFVIVGLVVVGLLYFAGNTNTPKSADGPSKAPQSAAEQSVTTETILAKAKQKINPDQAQRLALLENAVVRGDVKNQQIHVFVYNKNKLTPWFCLVSFILIWFQFNVFCCFLNYTSLHGTCYHIACFCFVS